MRTQSTLRKIFTHVGFCALWCIFQLLPVINFITTITTNEWIQIAYNCLSLIIVFYAVSNTLGTFLAYRASGVYSDKYRYKIFYIFNTHLLFCGTIVFFYLYISVYLDIYYFENRYPDLVIHFCKRFERARDVVWPAMGYAFVLFRERMRFNREAEKDEYIRMLEDNAKESEIFIRELYSQLYPMPSVN